MKQSAEFNECTRKKFFREETRAQQILRQGIIEGWYDHDCHVYKCRFCIGHHIGHKRKE